MPEPPVSGASAAGEEPDWRMRLRSEVERSVRQRAARAEHRRALSARRTAGIQTRQATRLARIDNAATDLS